MNRKNKNTLLKSLIVAGTLPLCGVPALAEASPENLPPAPPSEAGEVPPPPPPASAENAFVSYSFLGVAIDTLPAATSCENSRPGVLVVFVLKDSPADKVGLQNGDILVELDGQKLFFPNQFSALVRSYKPGTEVKIVLFRNGEKIEKTAVIGERRIPVRPKAPKPDARAKDDVRIYINGREISLAEGSDLGGFVSLTPDGILIRDGLDVPSEFRGIVSRMNAKLPDSRRMLTDLRKQYDDACRAARGNTRQTFSQVFFGNGNSVIIVGDEKGRQITVSRAGDDEVLFRGNCTTQEEIDAIPEDAREIIENFTELKPMALPPTAN